ncbi:MAG: FecR domain-containing protein [Limisphaerales bacterium]
MNLDPGKEALLHRYLDGRLTVAEANELAAWLRAEPEARAWLRELSSQAVMLGDQSRSRAWRVEPFSVAAPAPHVTHPRFQRPQWIALAAGLTLLAALAVLWRPSVSRLEPATLVEVEEVTGSLSWSSADGASRTLLKRGARAAAGGFEAAGDGSMAQLRFVDGTRLILGGTTQIAVSDTGHKRVQLRSGVLGADVRPQPPGHPLEIVTSTARLEVVGTKFSVRAEGDVTVLNVETGRVLLHRLRDGRAVEVGENESALVSLGIEELRPTLPRAQPTTWRHSFTAPPPPYWSGEWLPATADTPARAKAILRVYRNLLDGAPAVRHCVVALSDSRGMSLSKLTPASVLRARVRTTAPGTIWVFITVLHANGVFAGNFETNLPLSPKAGSVNQWQSISIPVSSLRPTLFSLPDLPTDGGVRQLIVGSHEHIHMEVAELSIEPAAQ